MFADNAVAVELILLIQITTTSPFLQFKDVVSLSFEDICFCGCFLVELASCPALIHSFYPYAAFHII